MKRTLDCRSSHAMKGNICLSFFFVIPFNCLRCLNFDSSSSYNTSQQVYKFLQTAHRFDLCQFYLVIEPLFRFSLIEKQEQRQGWGMKMQEPRCGYLFLVARLRFFSSSYFGPVYHFTLLTSCPSFSSSSQVTWKITILLHLTSLTRC